MKKRTVTLNIPKELEKTTYARGDTVTVELPTKTNSICQRLAIAVDRIEAQLLRLENF